MPRETHDGEADQEGFKRSDSNNATAPLEWHPLGPLGV
jgi:hypothetical protein